MHSEDGIHFSMGKPCSDRCYCGGKGLFLQMQDILLLSESRLSSLNSVAFSTAAPVPRHTVTDWKVTQLSSRDLQIFFQLSVSLNICIQQLEVLIISLYLYG